MSFNTRDCNNLSVNDIKQTGVLLVLASKLWDGAAVYLQHTSLPD